jgi:hypothetical protein
MKTKQLNKVRAMKGVRPGRGSAGRAKRAGWHQGRAMTVGFTARMDSYADVGRACQVWLRDHGVACGGFREVMMAAMRERKM